MIELHQHCNIQKCKLHERDITICTTCKRIGKVECTLIPVRSDCPRCGGEEGRCEHYRGF